MTATIQLGDGIRVLVDDDDLPNLINRNWIAHKASGKTYAAVRPVEAGHRRIIYLHREIAGAGGRRIRFKNGNTLDCRRENLVESEAFREARSIDKGAQAEAMVCADLIRQGHDVFTPFSGHSSADLISVKGSSRPIRWQVKHRKAVGEGRSISLSLYGVRTARGGLSRIAIDLSKVDAFAIYCPDDGGIYYVPVSCIPAGASSFNLNISSLGPRTGFRLARDYRSADSVFVTLDDTL